jgi:ABC-type Na+ efflux pump permease subunit
MSSSYIIRAVVEEKSSKLIDLLLVSVQPLALLCGKILAMMTVVFGTLLTIALGTGLSTAVTGMFLDTSVIGTGLGEMGISLTSLNLGVGTVIVVIISLLFSYLTYSIMSGIAGASCSSMNDVEGAMMGITLTAMVGYVVACAASAVPDRTVALLTSLIPIVSSFCAPAHYICGRIGMGVMLLSWAIQIGMIIVLALFGANVYRDLILYRGKRLRLRDMLRIAGMRGGVRRDA